MTLSVDGKQRKGAKADRHTAPQSVHDLVAKTDRKSAQAYRYDQRSIDLR